MIDALKKKHNSQNRQPYTMPRRDRKSTLFQKMLEEARTDGSILEIEPILHDVHPERSAPIMGREDTYLTDYRFDIVPQLTFGSNEGIYLTLLLDGTFDSSGDRRTQLGTLKTLNRDIASCRLMGALGGILMYHGYRYVEREIYRYTPEWELAEELEKRGELCGD